MNFQKRYHVFAHYMTYSTIGPHSLLNALTAYIFTKTIPLTLDCLLRKNEPTNYSMSKGSIVKETDNIHK